MAWEYARAGVGVTMGRASIGMSEQRFKRAGVESGKRRMYQEALNHSPCHTSQENIRIELSEKGRCRGMKQEMLSDIEYGCRRKETKREKFLEIMDEMIPWDEWNEGDRTLLSQGKRCRPPMGIEKTLRMYLLQIWSTCLIRAPRTRSRNAPDEMGNAWQFGMKCPIGVAARGGINRRPHSIPRVSDNAIDWECSIENRKSSVRSKVEHVFRIIKCQLGYRKTVYRGLNKNENRLYAMLNVGLLSAMEQRAINVGRARLVVIPSPCKS